MSKDPKERSTFPRERSAFPCVFQTEVGKIFRTGMNLREYFAAHAPEKPEKWFEPKVRPLPELKELMQLEEFEKQIFLWRIEYKRQHVIQWPWAWADAVLAAGEP